MYLIKYIMKLESIPDPNIFYRSFSQLEDKLYKIFIPLQNILQQQRDIWLCRTHGQTLKRIYKYQKYVSLIIFFIGTTYTNYNNRIFVISNLINKLDFKDLLKSFYKPPNLQDSQLIFLIKNNKNYCNILINQLHEIIINNNL